MTAEAEAFLVLQGLTKKFGNFTAVRDVSLEIAEGEFFTLVGPSGSGKTTLIRLLVGMDQPTGGEIRLKKILEVTADNLDAAVEMAQASPFLEMGTIEVAEAVQM